MALTLEERQQICITVAQYEELLDDQKLLDALRACGVDNWEGWDDAIRLYNGEEE